MRLSVIAAAAALLSSTVPSLADHLHGVLYAYLSSGNPGTMLSQGDNKVDAAKLRCRGHVYSSCTFALIAMDTVCHLGDGTFTIIVSVDGTPVGTGQSITGSADSCFWGTWVGNVSVASGLHTVVLDTNYGSSGSGATQGQWSANYTITAP